MLSSWKEEQWLLMLKGERIANDDKTEHLVAKHAVR
jgi:hypothetical protein